MSIGKIILAGASIFFWAIFWTTLLGGLVHFSKNDLLMFACFGGFCMTVVWGLGIISRFGTKSKVGKS